MRPMNLRKSPQARLNIIAGLVALSGLFTLSSTLFELKHITQVRLVIADAHFTLIAGLSLVYLGMLLRRGKRNAWWVAVAVFGILLVRNIRHLLLDVNFDEAYIFHLFTVLALPGLTLGLLIIGKDLFRVKSEVLSFSIALQRAVLILAVGFLYGVVGFQLFDTKDFHQEISLPAAAHYTVDQFGLTNHHVTAHTKRSLFFIDSLGALSVTAVVYAAVSFFAPIRFRLVHRHRDYQDAYRLLSAHSSTSEDFFKLWPRDKAYFFNDERSAFIAYKTAGSTALVLGDPVGSPSKLKNLIIDFEDFCRLNDWTPAFIHSEPQQQPLYKSLGYETQKIGEEAIVDIANFTNNVKQSKYFRHINNKFTKLGYSCQLLEPPHSVADLARLRQISDDWLSLPGRAERRFAMGYFNNQYMNLCKIFVIKDPAGAIQGFINELPFYASEANFDFLRHSLDSPGNINDFLMINFIDSLAERGLKKVNMGLAPLAGLDKDEHTESQLINSFLNFAYANGSRFYAFKGLQRFKAKYDPSWQSRYIVYKGGLKGFSKTLNSLIKAMSLKRR